MMDMSNVHPQAKADTWNVKQPWDLIFASIKLGKIVK